MHAAAAEVPAPSPWTCSRPLADIPAYSEDRSSTAWLARITEEQRSRWAFLIAASTDEAGLPDDPEFRSALVAYVEWGTRIAMANSAPGAAPPAELPAPRSGWGEAPPYLR